jgi:hypothetical protein
MSEVKEFNREMKENILVAFEVPDSFFISYGTTDLKVVHQMENFKRVMRSKQSQIGHVLMDQLIVPMVKEKFGIDIADMSEEDMPRLVWNNIIQKDIIEYARAAASLFDKGVLDQDEARSIIGFEPPEKDLEDQLKEEPEEPEEPNIEDEEEPNNEDEENDIQ